NFYAMQPGAGGYLFLHWLKSCQVGVVFGGSDDAHRITRQQKWTYYAGLRTFRLNRAYPKHAQDAKWRAIAKSALERMRPLLGKYASRIPPEVCRTTTVQEERDYEPDLLPRFSPFHFRFAPTLAHLAWRYNTRLSFVRYRLFRILHGGKTAGYVVLNDLPHALMVAQCDGESAAVVAHGVLLSTMQAS